MKIGSTHVFHTIVECLSSIVVNIAPRSERREKKKLFVSLRLCSLRISASAHEKDFLRTHSLAQRRGCIDINKTIQADHSGFCSRARNTERRMLFWTSTENHFSSLAMKSFDFGDFFCTKCSRWKAQSGNIFAH